MSDPAELVHRLQAAAADSISNVSSVEDAKEALVRLRNFDANARAVRREATATKAAISSGHATANAHVSSPVVQLLAGRKAAGRSNALKRDSIRRHRRESQAPYDHLIAVIDHLLLQSSRYKAPLEAYIRGDQNALQVLARLAQSSQKKKGFSVVMKVGLAFLLFFVVVPAFVVIMVKSGTPEVVVSTPSPTAPAAKPLPQPKPPTSFDLGHSEGFAIGQADAKAGTPRRGVWAFQEGQRRSAAVLSDKTEWADGFHRGYDAGYVSIQKLP